MSKVCSVCAKAPTFGNNRSHSMRATPRRFNVNVQKVRILKGVTPVRAYVCTSLPQGRQGPQGGLSHLRCPRPAGRDATTCRRPAGWPSRRPRPRRPTRHCPCRRPERASACSCVSQVSTPKAHGTPVSQPDGHQAGRGRVADVVEVGGLAPDHDSEGDHRRVAVVRRQRPGGQGQLEGAGHPVVLEVARPAARPRRGARARPPAGARPARDGTRRPPPPSGSRGARDAEPGAEGRSGPSALDLARARWVEVSSKRRSWWWRMCPILSRFTLR